MYKGTNFDNTEHIVIKYNNANDRPMGNGSGIDFPNIKGLVNIMGFDIKKSFSSQDNHYILEGLCIDDNYSLVVKQNTKDKTIYLNNVKIELTLNNVEVKIKTIPGISGI